MDTNVIISAYFWGGVPGEVLESGILKEFEICTSPQILQEIRGKLSKKFNAIPEDIEDLTYLLLETSLVCYPCSGPNIITKDPTDNKIIECAVEGKADYIVSGDRHLLELKDYNGIKIMCPKEFLDLVKS